MARYYKTNNGKPDACETRLWKTFTLGTRWPIPNERDMFVEPLWESDDFARLKTELNDTKNRLNAYRLDEWHAHTARMNPAGLVVSHVRRHVRPDFPTQAWCKFYELACSEPELVPREAIDSKLASTVHLCEAPGAFVSALNHYMAINHRDVRLQWLAMTLHPYHEANGHSEAITDDRFIRNTLGNWEFGPDYTGDIFQPGYSEHLYGKVRSDGGACLVTADGSVDCSDDPGEQETVVMRLHHYETMVALNVLRPGGSLVLKSFTMFECNTICRMYLLCCVFRSVAVKKPVTSKPGNSEVYVVCTGYKGRKLALPYVRTFFATDEKRQSATAMFPARLVPENFRKILYRCAAYFSRSQTATIERNIEAWTDKERLYRAVDAVKGSLCRRFVVECGLRPIRRDQELVPGGCWRTRSETSRGGRFAERTSHDEKTRSRDAPDLARDADALHDELMRTVRRDDRRRGCGPDEDDDAAVHYYRGKRDDLTVDPSHARFRLGKPVTAVMGSMFCDESAIRCRVRAMTKFSQPPPPPPPPQAARHASDRRASYYRSRLGRPHAHVCDVTDACAMYAADNAALQRKCLEAVIGALRRLRSGGHLVVIGYPLYTQTSVACFFAVASMFAAHGLTTPDDRYGHALVFYDFEMHYGWMDVLNAAKRLASPGPRDGRSALISWFPVNLLFDQKAYADIVSFNDLCIAREVKQLLNPFVSPVTSQS